METLLITQARYGSSRLPGKILLSIENKTLLQIHLDRLKKCAKVDKLIVATTTNNLDKQVYNLVSSWGCDSICGSENDVLDRYYQAAKPHQPQWVVRVTSDCPLIDPCLVDQVITFAQTQNKDYVSNTIVEHYPDGQDVEVFKFSALRQAWEQATLLSDREHVTPYIRNNSDLKGGGLFTAVNYPCPKNYNHIRMTVDEERDFEMIRQLIENLGTNESWETYTNYIIENKLDTINGTIIRNEGFLKSLKND